MEYYSLGSYLVGYVGKPGVSGFAVLKRAFRKLVMLSVPALSKQPVFPLELFIQNNAVFRDVLGQHRNTLKIRFNYLKSDKS